MLSCSVDPLRKRDQTGLSDIQFAKVGNAGFHHFQIHFHEVILYAPRFCRGKNLLPIQTVFSYRHNLFRFGRPALHVHGNEAARILGELLRSIIAAADRGDLELELNQFRIEKIQQ